MKMEFPSSVVRMAWKTERPFWRPVSMTERRILESGVSIRVVSTCYKKETSTRVFLPLGQVVAGQPRRCTAVEPQG